MELQSSTLSFPANRSLSISEDTQQLSSAKNSSSQLLKSEQRSLEQSDHQSQTSGESSSVVSKLVAGVGDAVAVYGQLVAGAAVDVARKPANDSVKEVAVVRAEQVSKTSDKLAAEIDFERAELKVIQQLAARDRDVRAHEQAHASIGGPHAGSPSYSYTNGPDGRLYATAGQVSIDTSPVENDPRATLEKAQVIIRAALSVSDPSPADRQVAAEAKNIALKALSELRDDTVQEDDVGDVVRDSQIQAEQQKLQREEFLAEEELKQAKQERNEALANSRRQSMDASMDVLKEYNAQIHEIQETLRRLNVQLVDSGAFVKSFPEGSVIDQNV
ncbi:MAG: hypothetical protein MJK10_12415 [Pseudomonadales bacterium]|nr:hypothetical protein [Pseudomonadales bacterium]NRA16811.1 hypothetical protein [Oceanospirillaceae bacterium]